MLGLPVWLWVIVAAVVLIVAVARIFYARYRRMCQTVRDELTEFLKANHPEVEVLGERLGNLVVRTKDANEKVFELADVYVAVAQLPGMGKDSAARARIYPHAVRAFFQPALNAQELLAMARHADQIKPLLTRPESLNPAARALQTPLPALGLVVVYAIDLPNGPRFLDEEDGARLGLGVAELHRAALENLRRDFPRELLVGPLEKESASAVQANDFYNAARLLVVPELLQPGQELVAMIPHRDLLLLAPASLLRDESKLREGMQALDCTDHPPLLDRPVRVTRDGFELV